MLGLARDYGLSMRMPDYSWIDPVQQQMLPTIDEVSFDSFRLDPANYAQLLLELHPGLSEWAVHPELGDAEARAIGSLGPDLQQSDYDFLVSADAHEMIHGEGITLLSYEPLK
jgi:hypothetical protein